MGVCHTLGKGVKKDAKKAAEWYKKAAEQGEPNAQYTLGVCYEQGDGVGKKDHAKAVFWLTKAAAQGNQEAREAVKKF